MPRYRIQVDVPAGTSQSNAVSKSIEVEEQAVRDGLIFAPPGSAGTVRAELLFGEARLLPTAESDLTVLPGATDPAPIRRTFERSPTDLTLRAFAPQSNFPHTVTARIDVLSLDQVRQDVRVTEFADSAVSASQGASVDPQDLQDQE
jgi:hypothetical protein